MSVGEPSKGVVQSDVCVRQQVNSDVELLQIKDK